jgi:hypothetical protein
MVDSEGTVLLGLPASTIAAAVTQANKRLRCGQATAPKPASQAKRDAACLARNVAAAATRLLDEEANLATHLALAVAHKVASVTRHLAAEVAVAAAAEVAAVDKDLAFSVSSVEFLTVSKAGRLAAAVADFTVAVAEVCSASFTAVAVEVCSASFAAANNVMQQSSATQ